MTDFMLKNMKVSEGLLDNKKSAYLYSVENVNALVLKGIPFREAYQQVGTEIEKGTFQPRTDLSHTHEGSIGNLCNDLIRIKMEKLRKGFLFEAKNKALKKLLEPV